MCIGHCLSPRLQRVGLRLPRTMQSLADRKKLVGCNSLAAKTLLVP